MEPEYKEAAKQIRECLELGVSPTAEDIAVLLAFYDNTTDEA